MPVVATAAMAVMSHDVAEKQVLIGMVGEPQGYWLHLLMLRLDSARWVTVDPHMEMVVEDLSGEELIPVPRLLRCRPLAARIWSTTRSTKRE